MRFWLAGNCFSTDHKNGNIHLKKVDKIDFQPFLDFELKTRKVQYDSTGFKSRVIMVDGEVTFQIKKSGIEYYGNLDSSLLEFAAFQWAYCNDIDLVSVPGEVVENEVSTDKVIFYRDGKAINFHNYGQSQSSSMTDLEFSIPLDLEYLLANGSRPFWSENLMRRWLDFLSQLEEIYLHKYG